MKLLPITLPAVPDSEQNNAWNLAKNNAPFLRFDKLEPFLPVAVGFSVFETSAPSPSFKREISLPENCAYAIEYAIWWDWDIQHLYELEHLWVYLDQEHKLIFAEGSFHGGYHALETDKGDVPTFQNRLQAYSESGKHAFASSPTQLKKLRPFTASSCNENAGSGDVLINAMFKGKIQATPVSRRMCKRFMKAHAFTPSDDFSQSVDLSHLPLIPWESLKNWIPKRVNGWLEALARVPKLEAICLDCGDTLIDEGTEIKDEAGLVLSAELIPKAYQLLAALAEQGYRLALVADGFVKSFETIFEQHKFGTYFEVQIISETIGVAKPDAKMFKVALEQLAIKPEAYAQVLMVGNNLNRDIKGANLMGLTSIWLDWAPRRAKVPADASEVPDFIIKEPLELLEIVEQLEIELMKTVLSDLQPSRPS
jgi:putative hydrolase of the HAD superfamily